MVNLLRDGAAAADVQAGRHRRHHRRPGRGDRRRRRAATRWPATRSDSHHRHRPRPVGARPTNDNPVYYVQYAHARICRRCCATPPTSASTDADGFDPTLLAHEKEGELLRALAELPARGRRARPSCASRTGSPATSRTPPATYHRFYDNCRVLPQGDEEPTDLHRARLLLVAATRTVLGQRPRACSASPPPSGCERVRAHEAGALHADIGARGPAWLREPADPNALVPHLWSATARQGRRRAQRRRACALPDLVAEHGTPAYVLDEADFRARARAFRDAFAAYDVYYAGKAFLCTTVVALGRRGGALPRRLLRRRARPSRCGPASTRRGSASTATTRRYAELRRAVDAGRRPDHRRLLRRDRPARPRSPPRRGCTARVMVRVTAGVEAHTHEYIATAHEDQKFGFSITGGDAFEAVRRVARRRRARRCSACTPTSAARSSTPPASRSPPAGCSRCTPGSRDELGVELPEMDLGGGFGIAYTTQDDPAEPDAAGHRDDQDRRARVPGARRRRAAALDRAGPRDRRAGDVHGLRGRHGQAGRARRRRPAHLRLRRRRDERQHPHRALRRRLLLHARLARLRRAAGARPASSASTARPATSWSRTSSCPATCAPGDLLAVPGTGAYCRSMASNYNHALRPPVVAVRDGVARVVVRRETEDDLLATDVGLESES